MVSTAILVAVGIFFAAVLRGFTGFGFALAAVPLLSLALAPARVIPIVVLLQATAAFTDLRGSWRACDWRSTRWIVGGLVVGTPMGVLLLTSLSPDRVRLAIGLLIGASVALLGSGLRLPAKPPGKLACAVGAVSGIANGLAAMPGPPIVAYFLAIPHDGAEANVMARSSIIVAFAATGVAGLVMLLLRGLVERDALILSAAALPGLFIGSRLGVIGFRRSNPKLHRPVALAVLGALAIMLIVRSFV
jgi:uncharacterized membrane protein YfcA